MEFLEPVAPFAGRAKGLKSFLFKFVEHLFASHGVDLLLLLAVDPVLQKHRALYRVTATDLLLSGFAGSMLMMSTGKLDDL